MAKQTIGVGTTSDDGTGDTLRAAFIKVNANTDEIYDDIEDVQDSADSKLPLTGGSLAGDLLLPEMGSEDHSAVHKLHVAEEIERTTGIAITDVDIAADTDTVGVLRLAVTDTSGEAGRFVVRIKFRHPNQNDREIVIESYGLDSELTTITDTAELVTATKQGVYIGQSNVLIGGVTKNSGNTVLAVNGTLASLDIVDSVANLYGTFSYTASRLSVVPEKIERELDQGQLAGSYSVETMAEAFRSMGQTGVVSTRQYIANESYKPENRVFDANSLGAIAMHDHANYISMAGLGEYLAIVNGHPYRTRHNDYRLRKSIIGTTDEYAYEVIDPPALKSSIASKPTGVSGDAVDVASDTQAKYLKEIHTETPEDVEAYLAGAEFWWEIVNFTDLADAGLSFRHADAVYDLHERYNEFMQSATTGLTPQFENQNYAPMVKVDVDEDGNAVYVVMQYRMVTTRVGTFAKKGTNLEPPIITIGATNHGHVLNTQLTKQEADDLRDGTETSITLTSTDSGHTHNYTITWNGTKFIGVDTNVNHQHYVLIEEGFTGEIPFDKAKAAAGIIDTDNVFTFMQDPATNEIFNLTDEGTLNSRKARFTVEQLDRMVERVPGLDGEGSFIDERDVDPILLAEIGDDSLVDRDTGELNSAYYHRNYSIPSGNAAGRSATARGWNDPSLFVARNTKDNCFNKVSYFVPMEILAMTPEMGWNPYNIPEENLADFADGANGTGTFADPYTAYSIDTYYNFTPAGMYAENGEPDPADTSSKVWALSGIDSQPRQVQSSGVRTFTINMEQRMRFPIYPRFQDGSMEMRDLGFLRSRMTDTINNLVAVSTNVSTISSNLSSLTSETENRSTRVITDDTLFTENDFYNGVNKFTVDLSAKSIVVTYAEGIPSGFKIESSIHIANPGNSLTLIAGDGATEKFRRTRGIIETGGSSEISLAGQYEYEKIGDYWQKYRSYLYNLTEDNYLPGYVDASDPSVLRLYMSEPIDAVSGFTDYTYTVTMLNQSNRVFTIKGSNLDAGPATYTDTSNKVKTTNSGTFVGTSGTTIGGVSRNNGATINVVYGNMRAIDLVSSIANLWGDIKIVVSVVDGNSQVISREL